MTDILTLTEIKKQAADLTSQINTLNTAIATLNSTVATAQQLVDVSNSIHAKLTMARVNRIDATISSRLSTEDFTTAMAESSSMLMRQFGTGVVTSTTKVTIAPSTEKFFVLLNGENVYLNRLYSDYFVVGLSAAAGISNAKFSWQLIELI